MFMFGLEAADGRCEFLSPTQILEALEEEQKRGQSVAADGTENEQKVVPMEKEQTFPKTKAPLTTSDKGDEAHEEALLCACLKDPAIHSLPWDRKIWIYDVETKDKQHEDKVKAVASHLLDAGLSLDHLFYEEYSNRSGGPRTVYQYEDLVLREAQLVLCIGSPAFAAATPSLSGLGLFDHILRERRRSLPR